MTSPELGRRGWISIAPPWLLTAVPVEDGEISARLIRGGKIEPLLRGSTPLDDGQREKGD